MKVIYVQIMIDYDFVHVRSDSTCCIESRGSCNKTQICMPLSLLLR